MTNNAPNIIAKTIIKFWFNDIEQKSWFIKDSAFDQLLKEKFQAHISAALNHQYLDWENDPKSRLALILLLDQMTRNVFRDTPQAFAGDERALSLSLKAIQDNQLDQEADQDKRAFLLMPLMHSEDIRIQNKSIPLFEKYANEMTLKFAHQHRDIILRFGRYPHRNHILGRPSTTAEIEFLKNPNSGF